MKSNIQRQIGEYVSEMRMQIHPGNDATAMLNYAKQKLRQIETAAKR